MCGIVGYCGSKRPDISKLKLLSINVQERGKEGMGCLINNDVTRGIYEYQKDLSDPIKFFSYYWFPLPTKLQSNTVIIHNRAPTRGVRSLTNTHPFEYLIEHDPENIEQLFFAKNGTITNEHELCELYGLTKSDFEVDSKLLGHIIVNFGWDVLLQYKGGAAMVLYSTREPNTIYIYKGMSLEGNVLIEERPMHYIEVSGGMYFASTKAALQCALDAPFDKIKTFTPNILYKITDGRIVEETLYDRSTVQNKPAVTYTHTIYNTYKKPSTKTEKSENKYFYGKTEPKPIRIVGGKKVYYWNGLYHRNGHPISGIIKLNDSGLEIKSSETGTTYYFHKGLMLKNEACMEQAQKIISKVKQIKDNIESLLPLLSLNYTLFIFKHSPARQCMKLYCYNGCQELTATRFQTIPLFSVYKYSFDIIDNCFTIEKLQEEEKNDLFTQDDSSSKNSDPWDPETWNLEGWGSEMMNRNFNIPTVEEDNQISKKLKLITKYIKKTIVEYDTTGLDSPEEIRHLKVCYVALEIFKNPEFAEMLFDDLEQTICETIKTIEQENEDERRNN